MKNEGLGKDDRLKAMEERYLAIIAEKDARIKD